jgi:hypothetical protein
VKRKGLFVLAILLLPSLIYVFFALSKANFRKLPYHGPKAVRDTLINGAPRKDTVYYAIPPMVMYGIVRNDTIYTSNPQFALFDSQGNRTSIQTLLSISRNVHIASFIRKWDAGTAKQLKGLAEYAKMQKADIDFINFVFFVESDTAAPKPYPEVADTLGLDKGKCITLHGSKEQLDMLEKLYYVGIEKEMMKLIDQVVLVDQDRHVRGYYDISFVAGVKILKEDYEHLLLHDKAEETKQQFNIETKRK